MSKVWKRAIYTIGFTSVLFAISRKGLYNKMNTFVPVAGWDCKNWMRLAGADCALGISSVKDWLPPNINAGPQLGQSLCSVRHESDV